MIKPYKDLSSEEKKRDWKDITYQVVLVGTVAGAIWLSTDRTVQALAVVVDVGMALMSMIMAAPTMLMVTPRTAIRI